MDVDKMFEDMNNVPQGAAIPETSNKGKQELEKLWLEDIAPTNIDKDVLGKDDKSFVVDGSKVEGETLQTAMEIMMKLNMASYKMRTTGSSNTELGSTFLKGITEKELIAPFKNKETHNYYCNSLSMEHYKYACYTYINIFKDKTPADFNAGKPGKKIFKALEMVTMLGCDLKTKPGFIIVNTQCGSTGIKGIDFKTMDFNTYMLFKYSWFFNIKLYNLNNSESLQELQLKLAS